MTPTETEPIQPSQTPERIEFKLKPEVLSASKILIVSHAKHLPLELKSVVESSGCDYGLLSLFEARNLHQVEWLSLDAVIFSLSSCTELRSDDPVFQQVTGSTKTVVLHETAESCGKIDNATIELSSPYKESLSAFLVGLQHSNRDQSDRNNAKLKLAEERLRENEIRFQQLAEKLTQVSRVLALHELAAGIIHEASQPLTAITAFSFACERLLLDSQLTQDEKKHISDLLGQIETQSFRAGTIIQNLKKLVVESSPLIDVVDLNQCLKSALKLLNSKIQKNSVSFRMKLQENLSTIQGDAVQLEQVFLNIFQNSIDILATSRQDRVVEVQTKSISNGDLEVSVSDSGSGVSIEDLNRIFLPFFTTNPQKIGLGLSIGKSIVEAHHGKISADINGIRGMTITVTFPVVRN